MEEVNEINLPPETPERPMFLTVLCILTFIGSGWGLLSGVISLITPNLMNFFSQTAAVKPDLMTSLFSIGSALLCLMGAIRMWSLYKSGYTLYLLGIILAIAAVILTASTAGDAVQQAMSHSRVELDQQTKSMAKNIGKISIWVGIAFSILVDIVFAILYGVNRKHLVK